MLKVLIATLLILFSPMASSSGISQEKAPGLDKFAQNVTLHVVLHELGHALVREFDLPILGNEETLADSFATFYVLRHMPDRAKDVVQARVRSLMIEANEIPREEWTVEGEHNNDARRAYQITALALAVDGVAYAPLAKEIGMSQRAIENASDYGTEIHRSWRRILRPLMMPEGKASTECRVTFDQGSQFANVIQASGLGDEILGALQRFDWHSQVKVFFVEGDGGAGWNRSRRTISVRDGYIQRFVNQSAKISNNPR